MDRPAAAWHIDSNGDELRYRGFPIARIYIEPDGAVEVVTRCYSEGYTNKRRMATATGGRRYVEVWIRKWGAEAMREVDNRINAAEIEAAYRAALPKVEILPDPRKPRKGRKPF